MKKKQLDLFGDTVSNSNLTKLIEGIKSKIESTSNNIELEPIMKIIVQERDILKLPVKQLLRKILVFFKSLDKAVKPKIVKSVLEALKELQKIQEDEVSKLTFLKVYRRRKDLYEFFLTDSSNLLVQFYRIFSFIHFYTILIGKISSDTEDATGRVDFDSKDGEAWYEVYEREEDRIILHVCVGIVDGELQEISRYPNIKTDIPLKITDSIPDSLKKKYVLSTNN